MPFVAVLALLVIASHISTAFQIYAPIGQAHGSSFSVNSGSNLGNNSAPINESALMWFFGYLGDKFFPQTELGISQTQMLDYAQNLSLTIGKPYLKLLTAVDEVPMKDGVITPSYVSQIASYVANLKQYASGVYGRLETDQFNLSASKYGNCRPWSMCPIYRQSALYIDTLGLNGIWFDDPIHYMAKVGLVTFNKMMQNLTVMFPNATFFLNVTPNPSRFGYVSELPGYTWENQTYVTVSAPLKQLLPTTSNLQQFNSRFPDHVLMHFDATGPPGYIELWSEPMSIFANESNSAEISTLAYILQNGMHPQMANESYGTIVPILGSWTFQGTVPPKCGKICPNYHGTLYDSFDIGKYPRATYWNFTLDVCEYVVANCTLPADNSTVAA